MWLVSGMYCTWAALYDGSEDAGLGSKGAGKSDLKAEVDKGARLHSDRTGQMLSMRVRPGKADVHIRCTSSMQASRWGRNVAVPAARVDMRRLGTGGGRCDAERRSWGEPELMRRTMIVCATELPTSRMASRRQGYVGELGIAPGACVNRRHEKSRSTPETRSMSP